MGISPGITLRLPRPPPASDGRLKISHSDISERGSLSLLSFTVLSLSPGAVGDQTLWYRQPARVPMNEVLPLGNGRLGGPVLGAPEKARLVVNEAEKEPLALRHQK